MYGGIYKKFKQLSFDDKVVRFLWLLKLKGRNEFNLVVEFMTPAPYDLTMPVLKNYFGCLGPFGSGFFQKYILGKKQFTQIIDKYTEHYNENILPLLYIEKITD